MRKLALITSIFILMTINTTAFANRTDEMTGLANAMTSNNFSVDNWQVTIKEEINEEAIESILEKIQNKNSYKVSRTKDENAIKYFIERVQKEAHLSETYSVVIPKNPMHQAELVAVLKGKNWNDSIAERYFSRMDAIHTTYFTHKSTKFACLTADIDAKINNAYVFKQLKQSLQLKNIRKQTDNVENSTVKKIVYGYTPLWEQSITMKQPMNVQMVVQNGTHDSKRLMIGTPILINEY
ncbi:YwmB family TATA-box binding protein [Lentibacillus salicampi]|uniref:YwmB family TATA-box binding protein n=1 Tax=Lentibacillus salicampi TaxID=175306 RepID=A0A4Y9ABE1_9BACI|nr:YwmB family TATA-box binding protein [Lentibacillus salicampi]TFJ92250.1 hypothetical protein E4U82_13390 [Lentibacillus salicampi]